MVNETYAMDGMRQFDYCVCSKNISEESPAKFVLSAGDKCRISNARSPICKDSSHLPG